MKIQYTQKRLTAKKKALIQQLDCIVSEYAERGMTITVRQLYYQCVARKILDNNKKCYEKISDIVADGRMAGLLDWEAIEDRTRTLRKNAHWSSPREILEDAKASYRIDTRATQPIYVEAWIEKDSLVSILEPVCRRLDVACFSCRGFPSITALHEAAQRIRRHDRVAILYAGDHDPSGLTIPETIKKAFNQFGVDVDFRRIGLTLDQIQQLKLPPFPAKEKDRNFQAYVKATGLTHAWELDALPPETLSAMFENEISRLTDFDELRKMEMIQNRHLEYFDELVANA